MYVIVSYDMVNTRMRIKVAKLLLNYGKRVQKSVFECLIDDKQFIKMKEDLEKLIDMKEDTVRYYILCQRCVPNIKISGWGTISEDEDVYIV